METKGERSLMLECGDGRWRMILIDTATNLVIRSHVVADPVEEGWKEEAPHVAELAFAEPGANIPVRHTSETWNPWDDPL